jgi:hypothetical protein
VREWDSTAEGGSSVTYSCVGVCVFVCVHTCVCVCARARVCVCVCSSYFSPHPHPYPSLTHHPHTLTFPPNNRANAWASGFLDAVAESAALRETDWGGASVAGAVVVVGASGWEEEAEGGGGSGLCVWGGRGVSVFVGFALFGFVSWEGLRGFWLYLRTYIHIHTH